MGIIVSILILLGFVWFLKKVSQDPDTSKTDAKSQIQQLKKELYFEIYSLKERVYNLESQLHGKNIKAEPQKIEPIKEQFEEIPEKQEPQAVEIQESISEEPANVTDKKSKKTEIESYITSDLFSKIGAVAVILGVGFFLKYSFDINLFNPVIQIFLSFLFASGLIFGSVHFFKKEKYQIFAQGISGIGIAVSYLTIYSGYNSYHLFNYPVACILMLITTIVAFSQSVKYNSMATAILALIGGFITPFIISGSNSNSLGLLTYLVFLNSLVVALLNKKESWKLIGIISVFITYITYFSIHMSSYNAPNQILSIIFLIVIWFLYFCFDVLKIKNSNYNYGFLNIENTVLFYLSVYNLYYQDTNSIVISTFLIGLTYLFSGLAVYYQHNKLDTYLKQNFYIFAILFAIATNLATAGFTKPALFSLEAFMLLYFGTQLEKPYIQKSSTAFFTISYLALLSNPQTYSLASVDGFIPIFNFRDLTFALLIGLTFLSVKVIEKDEKSQSLISFFRYSWATLLFVFLSLEINDIMLKISSSASSYSRDLINFNKGMIQVIIWSLYSTKLLSVGLDKNIKPFTVLGSIGSTIAVVTLFAQGTTYYPIERYIPVLNLRFVTFIISAINLMYISSLLKRYNKGIEVQSFLDYAWGIMLFLLVNFEIKDCFSSFDSTMQLTLSGGWLIYSILGMYLGIVKRIKSLRYISLFVLGLTILKVFIFDLSFLDQLGRIISFIGLGVILLLLSFLYQKYSVQIKKLINEDIII